MNTEAESTGRLKVGDIIELQGEQHVVWFINQSRASVAPIDSAIQHRTREEDGKIQFMARESVNISPNSEVKVIQSLGRKGLAEHIDKRASEITEERKNNMKKKEKKEKAEKTHGKLGGFQGHSITSVIRFMGEQGWSLNETRAFFAEQKIDVADNTIKIQHRKGRLKLEAGADLDPKAMAKLRPDVPEEKPAKKDKKGKGKDAEKKGKKSKKNKAADAAEEDAEEAAAEEEGSEEEEQE